MTPLGWKGTPTKIIDRSSGMLVLLLVVWLLSFFKMIFSQPNPEVIRYNGSGFIQIAGDVPVPGVYHLYGLSPIKSILSDKAGLTLPEDHFQNTSSVPIRSGLKLTVLRDGEIWYFRNEEMSAFYKFTLGIPISLNRESEEGLTAIPGVGPKLAEVIVRERDKRGGFHDLNELVSVPGIGPGLMKRVNAYVTF